MRWYLTVVLICFSLIISNVEDLFSEADSYCYSSLTRDKRSFPWVLRQKFLEQDSEIWVTRPLFGSITICWRRRQSFPKDKRDWTQAWALKKLFWAHQAPQSVSVIIIFNPWKPPFFIILSALGLTVYKVFSTLSALREYSSSVFCSLIAVLSLWVCVVLCLSLWRLSPWGWELWLRLFLNPQEHTAWVFSPTPDRWSVNVEVNGVYGRSREPAWEKGETVYFCLQCHC